VSRQPRNKHRSGYDNHDANPEDWRREGILRHAQHEDGNENDNLDQDRCQCGNGQGGAALFDDRGVHVGVGFGALPRWYRPNMKVC
jgi:hypothetical protein